MSRYLCVGCLGLGVCRKRRVQAVSEQMMALEAFRADAQSDIAAELDSKNVPYRRALDYMIDKYRDFNGIIVDDQGRKVFIDTSPLIDAPEQWWRDVFYRNTGKPIRVRAENKDRLIALFSIQKATNPHTAQFWGLRGMAANDNEKL